MTAKADNQALFNLERFILVAKKRMSSLLEKEINLPMPSKIASSKLGKSRKIRLPRYFRDSIREMKKVTWPSRKETWKLTFAVLVFSALFTIFIIIVDYGFKRLAERVFL